MPSDSDGSPVEWTIQSIHTAMIGRGARHSSAVGTIGQAQRYRSTSLARCVLARIADMPQNRLEELLPWNWEPKDLEKGGLTMQLNKVHAVTTINRVAAELGETVDRIFEIAIEMETEDGMIWIYSLDDDGGKIAFTEDGVECLRNRIEEHQSGGH